MNLTTALGLMVLALIGIALALLLLYVFFRQAVEIAKMRR